MDKYSLEFNPEYNLHRITDKLYCVEMPNAYDLAMLFVRYQEYYESPNPNVRGQDYSLEEYIRWYSIKGRGKISQYNSFSYPEDFCGYNIPSSAIIRVKHPNMYDRLMQVIKNRIVRDIKEYSTDVDYTFYLIGSENMDSETLKHEISHGLYHLNENYKEKANKLINDLDKKDIKKFIEVLKTYHYCEVMYDEITAFTSTGEMRDSFPNINPKKFKKHFKKYYKLITPQLI